MKKKISFAVSVVLAVTMMAGCGEAVSIDPGRNIELVEPADASVDNLETVQRRNIYDATVYEANVYPYVEEYGFEDKSYNFDVYGAYPGDIVKKGDVLIYTTTDSLDTQIESMQTRLQNLTDTINEYGADAAEEYAELKAIVTEGDWILNELERNKPAETITADGKQVANPEYTAWKKEYDDWTVKRNKAEFDIEVLHSENDQKVALYNLDYAYYNGQLQELLAEKENSNLRSQMDGEVVAIQQLSTGSKLTIGKPLVAVADMSQKFIKCEPIDIRLIGAAYETYALIDGERYEVTYQESEDERCSTFVLHDEKDNVDIGEYAVLVNVSKCTKDALTISNDAIHQDTIKKYVHILKDDKVTTKEVKTGMSDGMFTEILSGLEEGDKVVVGEVKAPGPNTAVLVEEVVSTTYTYSGEMYYPITWWESYEPKYVEAKFVEYLVEAYQVVEEGDPLVRISLEVDHGALEEKETELLREKQRLADYIETNKDNIETNESVANRISSWQEQIDALEEVVEEMREEYTATIVTASRAGQIQTLVRRDGGQSLDEIGDRMVHMCDNKVAYITADPKGFINYGTNLTVEYTNLENKRDTCVGKVVTLGEYGVSEALVTDGVLVKVPDEILENLQAQKTGPIILGSTRTKPALFGEGKVMKGVIKVPADAVTETEDGNTYVDVLLQDGTVKTIPFISGGNTRSYYWAVDGLEVGMTICW